MTAYLLKYTALNCEGYKLVYANSEEEAISILEDKLFYLTQLYIESATL